MHGKQNFDYKYFQYFAFTVYDQKYILLSEDMAAGNQSVVFKKKVCKRGFKMDQVSNKNIEWTKKKDTKFWTENQIYIKFWTDKAKNITFRTHNQ